MWEIKVSALALEDYVLFLETLVNISFIYKFHCLDPI